MIINDFIKEIMLNFIMQNKLSENVYQFYFSEFGSCVYLIKLGEDNILIDVSSRENKDELIMELEKLKIKPKDINFILLTHKHYDHIGNIDLFSNAKVYSFDNIDSFPLKIIKIIKVPGHTKDSLAFLYKNILFSGDTIFHDDGIGRTDFEDSVPGEMNKSLSKLKNLDYDILAPGHL